METYTFVGITYKGEVITKPITIDEYYYYQSIVAKLSVASHKQTVRVLQGDSKYATITLIHRKHEGR